jgi:membrane fusion protein (multidrug efflux system)
MKNKLIYVVLLVAALVPGGLLLKSHLNSAPPPPPVKANKAPTPVDVLEVRPKEVVDRIEALGTALANESARISANVTETIVDIHFEDGQMVQKGDLLVTLYQDEERAQRAAATEQLAEHKRELKRLRELVREDVIPQRDYDERLTLLNIAHQRIKEIEARIADRTLRAPFDGVLGLRQVSAGALVEPGDLITTIDDLSRIKLDFRVPTTFLGALQPGSEIHAHSAGLGDERFEGKVATIGTRIDPDTRSVLVRAVIANPEARLKPGMLMTVDLFYDQRQTLMIPEEAVVPVQHRNYVLVVGEDFIVERKEIVIGQRYLGEVEVVEGLSEAEMVIVRGTTRVQPGAQVSIRHRNPSRHTEG